MAIDWPTVWRSFEESGIISIEATFPPASFQGPSERKRAVADGVRELVRDSPYLFSHDLKVHIEWRVSERARYETDSSADVDNIIKPILDGLSGPHGIMIDDCQVQTLGCHWETPYYDGAGESFAIELRAMTLPEYIVERSNLLFIQLQRGLCFPAPDYHNSEILRAYADQVTKSLEVYDRLKSLGPEDQARMVLPIQRFFHRTRVNGFRIVQAADILGPSTSLPQRSN